MKSFDELSYGDEVHYVGPETFDGSAVAPKDWKQPYTFRFVSMYGTVCWLTKFNGPKNHAPDHPVNNPEYWECVEA